MKMSTLFSFFPLPLLVALILFCMSALPTVCRHFSSCSAPSHHLFTTGAPAHLQQSRTTHSHDKYGNGVFKAKKKKKKKSKNKVRSELLGGTLVSSARGHQPTQSTSCPHPASGSSSRNTEVNKYFQT